MSQVRLCPSCGAEVPVGSPADQCPKCLLKEGFRSDASAEHSLASTAPSPAATGFEPPPIDDLAPLFPQLELLDLLGKGGMGALATRARSAVGRFLHLKRSVGTRPLRNDSHEPVPCRPGSAILISWRFTTSGRPTGSFISSWSTSTARICDR